MATFQFTVGKQWVCWNDLKKDIDTYQEQNFINLWTPTTRLISTYKKNHPESDMKEDLKYTELVIACKHGGRKYKSQATTGERPQQLTQKIGCKFRIRITPTSDGQNLHCVSVNASHNHEINKMDYKFDPKVRKVDNQTEEEIANLLSLGANKKRIQSQFSKKTGKNILLKDLHNIATRTKESSYGSTSTKSEVRDLADWLNTEYPEVDKEFVINDDQELAGIYIQDPEMYSTYERFPEVLIVDATHKVNNNNMPLYGIMCVDGNGESHLAAAFIVQREDEVTLTKMVQCFKQHHPSWKDTKVVITDKDFTERAVFKSQMPQVTLEICLYHTLRTFSREVTVEKMRITSEQRTSMLESIQGITYSVSEDEYQDKYTKFCDVATAKVRQYFDNNWHSIRSQWVVGLKGANLANSTTNRIESFFSKLKSTVIHRSTLKEMLIQFFNLLDTLRNERYYRSVRTENKMHILSANATEDEQCYSAYVTTYAYDWLKKQMDMSSTVKVLNSRQVESSSGIKNTTVDSCDCISFKTMGMPCNHVFAMRRHHNLDLFCARLISNRWTRVYNKQTIRVTRIGSTSVSNTPTSIRTRVPSATEKFKKSQHVTNQLATILSQDVGAEEYESKLTDLKHLLSLWRENKPYSIIEHVVSEEVSTSNELNQSAEFHDKVPSITETSNITELIGDFQDIPTFDVPTFDIPTFDVPSSPLPSTSDVPQELSVVSPPTGFKDIPNPLDQLNMVALPAKTRKRGRPKGGVTTAVGLPRKKAKTGSVKFTEKSSLDQKKHILSWFVNTEIIEPAVKGYRLIEENQVELIPEQIPSACKDELVNIELVKCCFTNDGWLALSSVYREVQQSNWFCGTCQNELEEGTLQIGCDGCLNWHHARCVDRKRKPRSATWFCVKCK